MLRRLRSLALVLVTSTAVVVEPVWAGPPAPEVPEPEPEPDAAPVEGPALPPGEPKHEPPPPTIVPEPELEPHEGGSIEFAVPPPETGEPRPSAAPRPPGPTSAHENLGKAPDSGAAFLAGGLWLVPMATAGTVLLDLQFRSTHVPPYTGESGIIVAGAGLGAIGLTMIGMGIYRRVLLSRWGKRHRVITLPQGSGLLTSGTLAFLLGIGVLVAAVREENAIAGGVAGAMLVSAPIQIGVGGHFVRRYQRTGGWRPTRYTLSPFGLRLQF